MPSILRIGPSGGGGGDEWDDGPLDDIQFQQIGGLKIRHGRWIDAITLGIRSINETDENNITWLGRHGGDGGSEDTVIFHPQEHILHMFGRSGNYIDSITIETSGIASRTFGKFGGDGGVTPYDFFLNRGPTGEFLGVIAGLFGRCKTYLDALGYYQLTP